MFAGAAAGALVFVLAPSPALAQEGVAVVTGTVVDAATKQPIPDVLVAVASPALQGEQLVLTDATGQYRIPNLPSGQYSMRLERDGYRQLDRSDIVLRADSTIRVDAQLLPEAVTGEEVTVVAIRAPSVDVGSSSTGMNINADLTRNVPLVAPGGKGSAQRSFEAVAEAAPGARSDTYGTSLSGTTSPENNYVLDGLSVNNPAYGIIGTPLSVEFIGEVNVITGGYMPEYGRATGGILNAVTKSGSNEFHGGVWAYYSPGALQGPRATVQGEGSTIVTQPKLSYEGDMGFDLGGPIVRDKLWFYTGVDVARTVYFLDRSLNRTVLDSSGAPVKDANGLTQTTFIPGTLNDYLATVTTLQTFGKFTYTVNDNNKLILTAIAAPSYSGGGQDFGIDPTTGMPEKPRTNGSEQAVDLSGKQSAMAHKFVGGAFDVGLRWTSEKDNKSIIFDTSVGWHHEEGGRQPSDGSTVGGNSGLAGIPSVVWRRSSPGPHSINDFEHLPDSTVCEPYGSQNAVLCPVANYVSGGPDFLDVQKLDRWQARHVLTYLARGLGHHVLKAGVDAELIRYDHLRAYSGGRRLRESPDGQTFVDQRQFGFLVGPDQPVVLDSLHWTTNAITAGGFVQDSWSILDTVTLNIGARYDVQTIFSGDGAIAMTLPNEFSPRLGVIYDPTRAGRSKVYGNYARLYESVPLDVADRAGSGEPQIAGTHSLSTCDPRSSTQLQGSCTSNTNLVRSGTASAPDQKWTVIGAGKEPIDPNLQPQSSDELVFGGEYEVVKDGRVGLSYTRRWMNNVIEDMSRDEAQTYFVGNPGSGIAKDFPRAERNYDAGTLYFTKVFADDWLTQASYTISYLRGNYAGLFRPETTQLDPNINSDFDLKSLTVNRTGPLPGDHTHDIKLFGARDFTLPGRSHLTIGGAFRARSGEPTNYLGSHPIYGLDEVFLLPRGAGDRLPWTFDVDLHLGYAFRLANTSSLIATVDVFNLFDFQAATAVDQRYTAADVQPVANGTLGGLDGLKTSTGGLLDPSQKNPNFGRPTQYQRPRTFRFGVRFTF
jgi:hypothetical protein